MNASRYITKRFAIFNERIAVVIDEERAIGCLQMGSKQGNNKKKVNAHL